MSDFIDLGTSVLIKDYRDRVTATAVALFFGFVVSIKSFRLILPPKVMSPS